MKAKLITLLLCGTVISITTIAQVQRRTYIAAKPSNTAFKPIAFQYNNKPDVDLRPLIAQYKMEIRNQGTRGTCSVFALTFLLEYMYNHSLAINQPDLSEEYLNFVSNKVINENNDGGLFDDLNKGYQQWGMMPENKATYQSTPVNTIAQNLLDEGKLWTRFSPDFIKPWNSMNGATSLQIQKTIEYLDKGIPVAFGGWWAKEQFRTTTNILGVDLMDVPPIMQKDYNDEKNPNGIMSDGHSVALVGYKKGSGFPGGGYFIFRNSWDTIYGDKGYGYMPFSYVESYANDLLAYTFQPLHTNYLGVQSLAAGKNNLNIFITANENMIGGANWDGGLNKGQWNAWFPILNFNRNIGTPVAAVKRDENKLDIFTIGQDGLVYTAAWDQYVSYSQWRGWWPVLSNKTIPGGQIAAVARAKDKLDIFMVGKDGNIYTAAWDQNQAEGKWRGWWQIGSLKAKPGSSISALARDANKLDVFVVGVDSKVYTAAWDAAVADGKWRGWWPINNNEVAANSPVIAVSRDAKKLDIFVTGKNNAVYTAAWDADVADGNWRGYWEIPGLKLNNATPSLAAVVRGPAQIDVFGIGSDNIVYTAAWDAAVENGKWRGWWNIQNGNAMSKGIAAVSRDGNKLDVFVIGMDNKVWTAAWDASVENGKWRGWWRVEF